MLLNTGINSITCFTLTRLEFSGLFVKMFAVILSNPICIPLCDVTLLLLEFSLSCDFLWLIVDDISYVTCLCLDFVSLQLPLSPSHCWGHVNNPGLVYWSLVAQIRALSTTRRVTKTNSDHEALGIEPQDNCSRMSKASHHNMGGRHATLPEAWIICSSVESWTNELLH